MKIIDTKEVPTGIQYVIPTEQARKAVQYRVGQTSELPKYSALDFWLVERGYPVGEELVFFL